MGDMGNDRDNPPAILFLCLGNICRSPLAEGAARAAFADAGIAARLDSAGTGERRTADVAEAKEKDRGGIVSIVAHIAHLSV